MTRSNTNYRTALVAPTPSDSIREAHSYEYDNNGNILYVNTSRVKPDMTAQPDTVQRAREERFRWDEENRLTALSQNGYVSHYWYDANGNLTSDRNKGIHAIVYNVLDLPSRVEFNDGHIIRYRYAADGRKLHTEYVLSNFTVIDNPGSPLIPLSGGAQPMASGTFIPGDGLPDPENQLETTLMTRDYCGSVIYRDGALERVLNDYGYMDGTGNYHYFIKDYQGNVRAVIDGQGALEEVNNYYPYGALLGGGTVGGNAGVQPYKYGTKELDCQNGLDWYDSQARHYDPLLGRTPTLDPLSEKYYSISPYAWCAGNPILLADLNGQKLVFADGSSRQFQHDFKITQEYLNNHNVGDLIAKLDKREEVIIISETDGKSSFDAKTNTLSWNPTGGVLTDLGVELSPATVLNHEADHALQELENPDKKKQDKATPNAQFHNEEEHRVIEGSERRTAEALGEIEPGQKTRTTHTGQEYKTLGPTTNIRDYSIKYATDLNEIEVIAIGKKRLTK